MYVYALLSDGQWSIFFIYYNLVKNKLVSDKYSRKEFKNKLVSDNYSRKEVESVSTSREHSVLAAFVGGNAGWKEIML